MAETITVTVPELPLVSAPTGDELIAVWDQGRLSRIPQGALRGTRTYSGPSAPPSTPSEIMALSPTPVLSDRWRHTETGDEWKVTSLDPFVWEPDGNVKGADGVSSEPGPPGGPGERGPAGPSGRTLTKLAGQNIPNWCAVILDGADMFRLADPSNPAHRQRVVGVVPEGVLSTFATIAQTAGDVKGPEGGFAANAPLFVGAGGILTPTPPASGWRQIVATAVSSNQIVVALGEARVVADEGTALIVPSGFAAPATSDDVAAGQDANKFVTPQALAAPLGSKLDQSAKASVAEAVSGQGEGTYATPDAMRRHHRARVGFSPYDYITDPAVQEAIRSGVNAPSCDVAFQQFLNDWIAAAGDCGSSATVPAGTWVFDSAREALLTSPGRNRRFHLHFSPGAKLVPSDANRFRYAVQGEWDPQSGAGFPPGDAEGAVGDVWVVTGYNNFFGLNASNPITNVNVGDQLYKSPTGWQKILCRANYRYQFWNAETNADSSGNLTILPGIGDEYDCFIVGKAGNATIDGVSGWELGDEAIFLRGKWRKKKVQGGTYRGVWDAVTNTPALNNSNGSPGDWYVVGGANPTFAPISLGNGNATGLGEFITTVPGEKIWCIAPGRWVKCYASPLFRGAWNPSTDRRRQQWYPASAPVGATNTTVGTTWADMPLASQGAYGDAYEITQPGTGVVGSLSRAWQRGEYAFYGANGWEVIRRDPNWDRGLLRIIVDEKTSLATTGRLQIAPRSRTSLLKEWSEGVYIRAHSTSRADYANYLYQGVMLDVEKVVVAGDAVEAGIAQGDAGICEGVIETRNLFIPTIGDISVLAPAGSGPLRRLEEQNYPRLHRFAVRHIDSYVTRCNHSNINGGFLRGYSVESEVWSVEQPSWEGGYLRLDGANMMTAAYIGHGLRACPALFEPTFEIECGDVGFARYGVHVKGHQGVLVNAGKPIMPGAGGSERMVEQPAFLMIEDSCDIRISLGMPTAGLYIDAENFSAFLRTRGGVFGTIVDGVSFQEMPAGVLFNLRHNNNQGQVFSTGYSGPEHRVTIASTSGHVGDTATRKAFYNDTSRTLAKGPDCLLPAELLLSNLINAANDAAAAAAGVRVGGEYRNGSVRMIRVA